MDIHGLDDYVQYKHVYMYLYSKYSVQNLFWQWHLLLVEVLHVSKFVQLYKS